MTVSTVDLDIKTQPALEGVTFRRNPRNGFAVMEVHFTADPSKRSAEWIKESKRGMPSQEWAREFDLVWVVHSGQPVFIDFTRETNVYEDDISPEKGVPLVRGWDFGLTPSCTILQYVGGRVNILDELYVEDMSIIQFAPIVFEHCNLYHPGNRWVDYCDPSGFQRKETDERTCAQVLMATGNISVRPGVMGIEKRLQAVEYYIAKNIGGRPAFMVNPSCSWTIDAFVGGYHFPEKRTASTKKQKRIPTKNEHSHIMDAIQYAVSRIRTGETFRRKLSKAIPTPAYQFQRGSAHVQKVVPRVWR